jgi:hypothetical protein
VKQKLSIKEKRTQIDEKFKIYVALMKINKNIIVEPLFKS